MIIRRLLLAVLALLAAIQLIRPARSNPAVDPAKTINAALAVNPAAAAIFERSCKDCHSNQTVWPWYSAIAPVSWLVTHDVNEGRGKMNFSEWSAYDSAEAHTLLEHMCKEVTADKMPPRDYTVMHSGTALSAADVKTICDWTATAAH
jgi:hypothetical protein